jgi:bifunctional DNA-binding transcriptional regulator/antitoxin component of YhaV-PrlF toxin-antitoxin module
LATTHPGVAEAGQRFMLFSTPPRLVTAMTNTTVDSEFRIQIPKELRDAFPAGCAVNVELDSEGRLLVSPHKYTLNELLAETPPDSVFKEWEAINPVGREVE